MKEILADSKRERLIYVNNLATPDFWDKLWSKEKRDLGSFVKSISLNNPLFKTIDKYLSPGAKILEGGCGRGQFVYGLTKKGYKCKGVDYAQETLKLLYQEFPELDFSFGDVTNLNEIENQSFDAYYSGGVIEHFWDGYHQILSEINRVLKPGGYIFITFPFMSKSRKNFINKRQIWSKEESPSNFYQFALDYKTVIRDFESLQFTIVELKKRNGLRGLIERYPDFKAPKKLYEFKGKNKLVRIFKYVLSDTLARIGFGHTILLVLRKSNEQG